LQSKAEQQKIEVVGVLLEVETFEKAVVVVV